MAKVKNVALADVLQPKGYIRGPFGSALKRAEMLSEGIPVYEQQHVIYNIRDFRFFISEEKFEELKRFQVQTNDLVISCSGTVGKVTIIEEDDPKGIISQALLILRVDSSKILPQYLKYFFESAEGYNSIVSRSSGSVQVNISKREVIEQIPLTLPELSVQRKIVDILKDFDNKAAVNCKMDRILKELALTLYRKMIIETDGAIKGVLSDIADVTMGQSPNGETYNEDGEGIVFYQGRREFGYRFPTRRLFTTDPKRMADVNDVLLSVRAPVGDLNVAYEACCIGRGLAAIHSKDNHQSFVLYTIYFLKDKFDVYNSEGTVFGSIKKASLNNMEILIPPIDIIEEFENVASALDLKIRYNYEEIIRWENMKKSMLPKLLSGNLDVSNLDI